MSQARIWQWSFYALSTVFVVTAALNLLQVRAGFLTNYAADIVVPAWLYIAFRGHAPGGRRGLIAAVIGRTPEVAAMTLFIASTFTEWTQLYWPQGIFRGTFDPLDIVAFGVGLGACYAAERMLMRRSSSGRKTHAPAA